MQFSECPLVPRDVFKVHSLICVAFGVSDDVFLVPPASMTHARMLNFGALSLFFASRHHAHHACVLYTLSLADANRSLIRERALSLEYDRRSVSEATYFESSDYFGYKVVHHPHHHRPRRDSFSIIVGSKYLA